MSKLFNTPININVATGTAPLAVSSTTLVDNLNADMLGGKHSSEYLLVGGAEAYVHPTTDGNLHVPATGTASNGKILVAGASAGVFSWQAIPTASTSTAGIISIATDAECIAAASTTKAMTPAGFLAVAAPALALKANLASPSFTGTVTATTFVGALTGNASSSTKLATARTIGLGTAATSTATNFDGTGND